MSLTNTEQALLVRDARRWRFTMAYQECEVEDRPEAYTKLWRKVYDEGRTHPTREEYEAATDEAIATLWGSQNTDWA